MSNMERKDGTNTLGKEVPPLQPEETTSGDLVESLTSSDYFLKNPPLQPKNEIADYVERHGILVPRRFKDLEEALEFVRNGGEIIIRSEHPQEYDGVSGLLESYILNWQRILDGKKTIEELGETIDWEEMSEEENRSTVIRKITNQIFGQIENIPQDTFEFLLKKFSEPNIDEYCNLTKTNKEEFLDNCSYSYWEKIPGTNRSIVADSSIPNRYHIFSKQQINKSLKSRREGQQFNYSIVENEEIVKTYLYSSQVYDVPENDLRRIIEMYEKIRNLDKFDPQHCPILEIQTDTENNDYFLQYHRTNNFKKSDFTLTRDIEEGEFLANYVRGSTGEKAIEIEVSIHLFSNYCDETKELPLTEKGALSFSANNIFSELMSRRRKVNIIIENSFSGLRNHEKKSQLFKPEIFLNLDANILPIEVWDKAYIYAEEKGEIPKLRVRIISDGKKAYVKILGGNFLEEG